MINIPTPAQIKAERARRIEEGAGGQLVKALVEALNAGKFSVSAKYDREAYIWAKDLFASKGWELKHTSGDQRDPESIYTLSEISKVPSYWEGR